MVYTVCICHLVGIFSVQNISTFIVCYMYLPALVAQLDAHPTGDQEVAGLTPAGSATFFGGNLIMRYFLWSVSPFRRFKIGSCQFLAKECAQYWLTA